MLGMSEQRVHPDAFCIRVNRDRRPKFPTLLGKTYAVTDTDAALQFYDYLLLLPTEIGMIWNSPPNVSSALYLWIRYAFLAQYLLSMAHDTHFTEGAGPYLTAQS